ncbi:hypothetical protein PILCRDRAFT_715514, partial [Piloderma croceum F 1598]
AFSILRFIWSSIQQAQASKGQLEALAQSIAQLLKALDEEYSTGRLLQVKTSTPLADLLRLLEDISSFIQKEALCGFLKLLFTKDQRIAQIDGYYRRIDDSIQSFQISALLDIRGWTKRNNDAREVDQQVLNEQLLKLETNQQRLMETLNMHQHNVMSMMVSLKRRLDHLSDGEREQQFFSHTLRYLTTVSGRQVKMESWMIMSYEVEFGPLIGSGGFGQVFKGNWNGTPVALKVLRTAAGITPSSTAIRREIETWSMLRHTHVLQFLGANEMDDRPFIVMPYLKNGNVRDYVQNYPDCDRLQICHHVCQGLVYLHSRNIIHGDLKCLNVLIDDSGKGVLCDFGLSRLKADATSRDVSADGMRTMGSRNWMAPEQLVSGSLKQPCDVYAFGMTMYEIFANEVPLGNIDHANFIELVVRQNVRPERPDGEEAAQLTDAIWELAEKCWVKDPKHRPIASAVCTTLSHLSSTPSIPRSTPISPSPPSTPPRHLVIRGHTAAVWSAVFSPDGKHIISGSSDRTICVWDAQTPNLVLGPLKVHTDEVSTVAVSPTGGQMASGGTDGTIVVWDTVAGKPAGGLLEGHTKSVWTVSFSPDGERIVSGSMDKTIRIWDVQTGRLLVGPLSGHTAPVTSVAFSGNGTRIASGSEDKTVRVWDATSGRLFWGPLIGHRSEVSFVAFSPDAKRIISLSLNGIVCVWNVETQALVSGPSLRHTEGALVVGFLARKALRGVSPDGKWVVVGYHNTAVVRDSQTGLLAASLEGHTDHILSLGFSPDSSCIVSASQDKTIRVHTLNL